MTSYSCSRIIKGLPDSVTCLKISHCGTYIGIGTLDGTVKIVELTSGRELVHVSWKSDVTTLLWHPLKHLYLFVGYGDGRLQLVPVSGILISPPLRCWLDNASGGGRLSWPTRSTNFGPIYSAYCISRLLWETSLSSSRNAYRYPRLERARLWLALAVLFSSSIDLSSGRWMDSCSHHRQAIYEQRKIPYRATFYSLDSCWWRTYNLLPQSWSKVSPPPSFDLTTNHDHSFRCFDMDLMKTSWHINSSTRMYVLRIPMPRQDGC